MKVCIVSSCGGHLTEVRCMREAYEQFDYFYVINDKIDLPEDMRNKTYFISHSERDWRFFQNLWQAVRILVKEKPTVILSTGAGPVIPFSIVGRIFFHVRVIYIETITRISEPSITGRIMYWISHYFFYQWRPLKKHFPKGRYGGPLI